MTFNEIRVTLNSRSKLQSLLSYSHNRSYVSLVDRGVGNSLIGWLKCEVGLTPPEGLFFVYLSRTVFFMETCLRNKFIYDL